ncbi:MAG: hypothetical protein KAY21_06980 [Limnohabitans sp.]|nr:hypothetical protein [Limnohabitans sp.]
MKKVLHKLILVLVMASLSSLALADGRYGPRHPGTGHGNHGSQRAAEWLGALVVLGLAGAAISAAASPPEPAAPPVSYVSPPIGYAAPPPAPVNAGYFCASARQFYPYTAYCPEGWQRVMPSR